MQGRKGTMCFKQFKNLTPVNIIYFLKMVKILFKEGKTNYTSKASPVQDAPALARASATELDSRTTS